MCAKSSVRRARSALKHLSHNLCLVVVILLLKFNCYKLSESVNSDYYSTGAGSNASLGLLRFHDFEPRYDNKPPQLNGNDNEAAARAADGADATQRQARGLHFHADRDDLSVELEFIVPFFKVPVKRSVDLARDALHSVLNLQTGTLVNTVLIVVAAASIFGIIKLLTTSLTMGTSFALANGFKSATPDGVEHGDFKSATLHKKMRSFTSTVESKLQEHNIDVSACIQRSICKYMRRTAHTVREGKATSGYAKLIDSLLSWQQLESYLQGTAVQRALTAAKSAKNCDQVYRSCKWPRKSNDVEPLSRLLRHIKLFSD